MSDSGTPQTGRIEGFAQPIDDSLEQIEHWYQYGDFAAAIGALQLPPVLNRPVASDAALIGDVTEMLLRPEQAEVFRPILVDALAKAASLILATERVPDTNPSTGTLPNTLQRYTAP